MTTAVEAFIERQTADRRAGALEALSEAIDESMAIEVPAPVTEVVPRDHRGLMPKLPAEAFELARQVYFLQHGTRADAARAIIAAGLSDTDDLVQVYERLKTWWARQKWPQRRTTTTFAIRDANYDGGLYRSARVCIGHTTGSGPAPKGKKCDQSALTDSEYCYHHDPRPEYQGIRRIEGERLARSRRGDMVPFAPFQQWCVRKRDEMLAQARASGQRLHYNTNGNGLLAELLQIDASIAARIIKDEWLQHGKKGGQEIRASTVVGYLEPTGTTFREVYGFDPPARRGAHNTCPECDGYKSHESKTCRECYERTVGAVRCPYIDRRDEVCGTPVMTGDEFCARHRRIMARRANPRPRTGRPSFVTTPMLILALGKYSEMPGWAWVARQMWAVNAAGVRDVFKKHRTLESALVKQARKRGWSTPAACAEALQALVDAHGAIAWPETDGPAPVEVAGMVPAEPFRLWLAARYAELGSWAQLGARIRMNQDNLSQWVRGRVVKTQIRRATVDRALEAWGDGTTYADLYVGSAA